MYTFKITLFIYVYILGKVNKSHFIYQAGKNATSYDHPNFVPRFIKRVIMMNNTKAKELCNNTVECMYDYITTKNDEIAKNTKLVMEISEENTEFRGKFKDFSTEKNLLRKLF